MNLRFLKHSHVKIKEASQKSEASIMMVDPTEFDQDGHAATCMEVRNSSPSGVREINRVSQWVYRIAALFAVLFMGSIFSILATAQDFTYEGINYSVIDAEAKTCRTKAGTIVDKKTVPGNQFVGNLNLPEVVSYNNEEYTLVEIGNRSFYDNQDLTGDLTIPSTVTKIDDYAFYRCSGLNGSLTLGDNIQIIGEYAFSDCIKLSGELILPTTLVEIQNDAFRSCEGFSGTLIIGDNVSTIGDSSFYACTGFTEVKLGKSLEIIGNFAFAYCRGLSGELVIPESVYLICGSAFADCAYHELIIKSSSLNGLTLAAGAFDMNSLSSVTCWSSIPPDVDATTFNANMPKGILFVPKEYLEKYKKAFIWRDFVNIIPTNGMVDPVVLKCTPDTQIHVGEYVDVEPVVNLDIPYYDKYGWGWGLNLKDVSSDGMTKRFEGCSSGTSRVEFYIELDNNVRYYKYIDIKVLPNGVAEKIAINKDEATLLVGQTERLVATIQPTDATDKSVRWASSDGKIATVDDTGLVSAISVGKATITATTVNGLTATCEITVLPVPAEGISLNKTEATLMAAGTIQLVATIAPETTTDKTVTWTSSDETVATVDAEGKVTAVAVGKATITATTVNGLTATCAITVIPTPAQGISLNKTEATLKVSETLALEATVNPETTTDKTVTWNSSDNRIATVDKNGVVTAVSAGKATIMATTANGLTATCAITVMPTPAEGISLNKTEATLMAAGTIQLVATIAPETTTDKTVTWTTSDETVATVDTEGKVTAVAVGKATITATTANGLTATCAITVMPTPAEGISLNKTEATLKVSETLTLEATVNPETTTDKTVTWNSSDNRIATVDKNGVVTAVSAGKATIMATTANGLTATCEITVEVEDSSVGTIGSDATAPANWITPTQNGVRIHLWSSDRTAVKVFTIEGAMMYSNVHEGGAEVSEELTSEQLVPGTYVVIVKSGKGTASKKVIIR